MSATDIAVRNDREVTTYDAQEGVIRIPTPVAGVHLTFKPDQRVLNDAQMVLLAPLGIKAEFDPRHVAAFLMDCQNRGFDPWANEAYLMKYPGDKYVRHIGIAGFRKRGESTGSYRGRVQAKFCDSDGVWLEVWPHRGRPPYAAKVGIRRTEFPEAEFVVALYDEYAPLQEEYEGPRDNRRKTGRKIPTPNWRSAAEGGKPTVMLAKCAEAAAWRAAFPERFNGFYAPEEFERERVAQAAGDDPAAARRKAAYAAAQTTQAPSVVEGTVVEEPAAAQPSPDDQERDRQLLLAELDEQGEILGKIPADLSARWSSSRGGRSIDTATVEELADHVHRIRPYVIQSLREQNRDDEATRYQAAPPVGACRDLFGRGPAVEQPPADAIGETAE